ncbi:hypothetical protein BO85DRAFT_487490 [Aspergillus piperis CBS 112811]|uniref:Uncharacterized protein n=1 Tax=Aspergillus piperis CBS 112811 TaxID=1448313 RepID=A0A8G1R397_9EURO|nr:hypothetical protein BO85DRAFT_487490 [Aspergillus piperis CBS 112811]RAH58783.1 hypothetical protein BO85DRAFT_487490 [Aspergillus piperis CBS 112811]
MTHSNISLSDPDSEPEVPRPLNTLHIMIREMLYEVRENRSTISALEAWVETVDPEAYRKDPWPQDLIDAHAQYKALVAEIDPKRMAYNNCRHNSGKNQTLYTPKVQLERLRLAYEWGQVALRAVEARLHVLLTYRTAYENKKAIEGHIEQAKANLNSARNAVIAAGEEYRGYWKAMPKEELPFKEE